MLQEEDLEVQSPFDRQQPSPLPCPLCVFRSHSYFLSHSITQVFFVRRRLKLGTLVISLYYLSLWVGECLPRPRRPLASLHSEEIWLLAVDRIASFARCW